VVDRYADRFGAALAAVTADAGQPAMAMLDHYLEPYRAFAGTADMVCLCGALAGEMPSLPAPMRARVAQFFVEHQSWLTATLERGRRGGEFVLADDARRVARLVFAALQGALLVKRTTGDSAQLDDVIAALKHELTDGAVGD